MKTTKVLDICYEKSDSVKHQGDQHSIITYTNNGYYVKNESNGNWRLVKPSKVIVTLKNSNGSATFNMKQDILNHYGKQCISKQILEEFKEDLERERVKIELSENCKEYSFN